MNEQAGEERLLKKAIDQMEREITVKAALSGKIREGQDNNIDPVDEDYINNVLAEYRQVFSPEKSSGKLSVSNLFLCSFGRRFRLGDNFSTTQNFSPIRYELFSWHNSQRNHVLC
ncbi:hypothetical protein L1987_54664 [Smallanthus sonchifolius]|uniref:Uncharacterized protein n=1 Tax=Smallanthus sonchifolius TaxID=185202 RepID=A0ACB9E8T2_9ASTR|nr:hypothetical protein L1987_54664 [Smallanthus sonchifolius]